VAYRFEKMESIKKVDFMINEHENNIKLIGMNLCDLDNEEQLLKNALEIKHTMHMELNEGLKKLPSLDVLKKKFMNFLSTLEIKNHSIAIRLLGDEVADRGCCDYFTLQFLNMLQMNRVHVTTLLSNHGIEFITAYEYLSMDEGFSPLNYLSSAQKTSFFGLKYLLDDELVTTGELLDLVNASYKPTLKLIDYTLNENTIRLFTHAPVDFEIILHLTNELEVSYCELTKEALGTTIDKINTVFQQIVFDNKVHTYLESYPGKSFRKLEDYIDAWSFLYLAWNRFDNAKDTLKMRPTHIHDYLIEYVHCHDEYYSGFDHVFNLNTLCGKEHLAKEREKKARAFSHFKDKMANPIDKEYAQDYLLKIFDYVTIESNDVQLNEIYTVDEIEDEFELFTSPFAPIYSDTQELLDVPEEDSNQSVFKMM
jgi:hypothetical protein